MKHLHTPAAQRGLSVVELMVGIAIGLFLVAGATKIFIDYLSSNRRLLVETRVNQDLRAAADVVVRDLRRAGYWNNSVAGVYSLGTTAVVANPHTTGAGAASSPSSTSVTYSYARNTDDVLDANENAGFQLVTQSSKGVLQMLDGQNNWLNLTDPATLDVTGFAVSAISPAQTNDLSKYCGCLKTLTCTLASPNTWANPPTLTMPTFTVILTGASVSDPSIVRTLNQTVRVRNARVTGACPA